MTWKEIKDKIESLGIADNTEIWLADNTEIWLIEITTVEFIQVDNRDDGTISITN